MTAEQLRAIQEANPFRPFRIHLTGGRTFDVPHRDFVSQSPSGKITIVYRPDDTWSAIDLYLVTELQVPPVVAAASNGQSS